MVVKVNPPDQPFDPKHPFAGTRILFAPKRSNSSDPNSSPKDSNPSAGAPGEELTRMDDPRWMKTAQGKIDRDALEHFRRIDAARNNPKP